MKNRILVISKEIPYDIVYKFAKETARMNKMHLRLRYTKKETFDVDFNMLLHDTNWYFWLWPNQL